VAVALLLQGCSALAPSEAALPTGAVPTAAPAVYQEWAQKTEACSGIRGDFSTVKWYVVPGVETFSTKDGEKVGLWISNGSGDTIILAGNYQNHEMVVSHEFLHHLLHREGHPQEYFSTKCHLTWETWD
jgi:hypothetical protein